MTDGSGALNTDDLLALVESGRELAAETGTVALLDRILRKAVDLTDSPDAAILLYDDQRRSLYFAHAIGDTAGKVLADWGRSSPQRVPLVGSKAGQVFNTGEPLVQGALNADADHFKGVDLDTGRTTESLLCVPLDVAGKRLGVVQLRNKRAGDYSARDVILIQHFAGQAAVALRNAQLFDDLLAHMGLFAGSRGDPAVLVEELSRPPRSEVVSVLFADMRGFTQLCQILPSPERTLGYLNEFLGMLSDAVIAEDGIVNKFLGDGLLALFMGEEHAARAVRAGHAMTVAFPERREAWNARSSAPLGFLDLGVGIATESVIIGSIGGHGIRDWTAVGTAVNLAAHLMEQAREGRRLLVDKLTFNGARAVIGEAIGPELFQLQKPGQAVGHPYERYHILTLTGETGGRLESPAREPAGTAPERAGIFISYCHKDKPWLLELRTHLAPLVRGGALSVWDDTAIKPGALWRDEIVRALSYTKVAVLLVSPNFLESAFIADEELPPLLRAAESQGVSILWIPLRASSWKETAIEKFQAVISPVRPLNALSEAERDESWVRICARIKEALR